MSSALGSAYAFLGERVVQVDRLPESAGRPVAAGGQRALAPTVQPWKLLRVAASKSSRATSRRRRRERAPSMRAARALGIAGDTDIDDVIRAVRSTLTALAA